MNKVKFPKGLFSVLQHGNDITRSLEGLNERMY